MVGGEQPSSELRQGGRRTKVLLGVSENCNEGGHSLADAFGVSGTPSVSEQFASLFKQTSGLLEVALAAQIEKLLSARSPSLNIHQLPHIEREFLALRRTA